DHLHRQDVTTEQISLVYPDRQIEGMMRHADLYDLSAERTEPFAYARDLTSVDAPVFSGERARGVKTEHGDLFVGVEWFEVVRDVATKLVERLRKPRPDVIERHVVIARHDDQRHARQCIKKRARRLELIGARTLRQITG